MRLLELVAFAPLSAPQIAEALHAQPRTVRRVLARLEAEGYVDVRGGHRRRYAPTMRLVALAAQVVENSALARTARPYVQLLRERTSATAHLVVPSYRQALCLVHAGGEGAPVRPQLRELVPAHCTAGGKALLAWRDPWRESVLSLPLERCTRHTVVEPELLRTALQDVRELGHALELEEYQDGVQAVAVPIAVAGEVSGALVASGRRLDVHAALAAIEPLAAELAEDLEHQAPVQ